MLCVQHIDVFNRHRLTAVVCPFAPCVCFLVAVSSLTTNTCSILCVPRQSPDLKNLDLNPELHDSLPCLMRLCALVYSADFRRRVEDAASLPHGTLNGKTDLASSIYTQVGEAATHRCTCARAHTHKQ